MLPGGAREQWGDKWREAFADGRGEKNGEVWSVDGGGHRYQRWWGEAHLGEGAVRIHGHSTSGEQWDEVIGMDTYYNPIVSCEEGVVRGSSSKLQRMLAAKTHGPCMELACS